MPEAPDPYGSAAYSQRILKEGAAAAQARNVLRCTGFYLTNPITHNDRLVETTATASSAKVLFGASRGASAAGRPASSAPSRPASQRRSARRDYEERVLQLEATLLEERHTRMTVEDKLAQLERVLAAKIAKRVVVE